MRAAMLAAISRRPRRGLLQRAARAVVLVALTVLALAELFALLRWLDPPGAYNKDFGQEYLLARAVWDGADTNLPVRDLAARYATAESFLDKDHPTPHPPSVGLLLLPLATLDYLVALRVWLGIQLACLVLSVWLLARSNRLPARLPGLLITSLCLVGWPPVALDLGMGQLTLPLLSLLAGAQLALGAGRPHLGGLLLGLSLLLKPLAWPWLLVLGRRRQWSAIIATLATVALGYAPLVLREGAGRVADYFLQVGPSLSAAFLHEPTNLSLWTLGPRLLPAQPTLASIVSAGAVALVLGLVWRWSAADRSLGTSLGVATAAAIVVSPISWEFYLLLALLPAAYVLGVLQRRGRPHLAAALGLVLLLPYAVAWLPPGGVPFGVYLLALLPALGVLCLSLARSNVAPAG
jgi:hypothetical protein